MVFCSAVSIKKHTFLLDSGLHLKLTICARLSLEHAAQHGVLLSGTAIWGVAHAAGGGSPRRWALLHAGLQRAPGAWGTIHILLSCFALGLARAMAGCPLRGPPLPLLPRTSAAPHCAGSHACSSRHCAESHPGCAEASSRCDLLQCDEAAGRWRNTHCENGEC